VKRFLFSLVGALILHLTACQRSRVTVEAMAPPPEPPPRVAVELRGNGFTIFDRTGEPWWEVRTEAVNLELQENQAEVAVAAAACVSRQEGADTAIRAEGLHWDREQEVVEFSGVEVSSAQQDTTFQTARATWTRDTAQFATQTPVTFHRGAITGQAQSLTADTALRMLDLKAVEARAREKGKAIWRATAETGHWEPDQPATLSKVECRLTTQEPATTGRAPKAQWDAEARTLTFPAGLTATSGEASFTAPWAVWEAKQNQFRAREGVTFTRGTAILTGQTLTAKTALGTAVLTTARARLQEPRQKARWDLRARRAETQRGKLVLTDVKGTRRDQTGPIDFTAGQIQGPLTGSTLTFSDGVTVHSTAHDFSLKAPRAAWNGEKQELVAFGPAVFRPFLQSPNPPTLKLAPGETLKYNLATGEYSGGKEGDKGTGGQGDRVNLVTILTLLPLHPLTWSSLILFQLRASVILGQKRNEPCTWPALSAKSSRPLRTPNITA